MLSGTLTFLFTDIEGSTQRWDRDRAAMQAAVRRHDAILRDAIEGNAGTVFKTIGDAFCAVFARPDEAVAAIVASQRALATEDFSAVDGVRVRMALHTGTADERDGDYYGPTLNRVARLLAIGHGGQMLLSRITADLVRDSLPSGVTLGQLGLHKLKDLSEPELVHQLVAADLPHEFPALRSSGATPNNLPAETSSFVGRETELRDVAAALEANRIVTVLGMGGIGKTRLSLQVAATALDRFPNGVWFVEFAATSDSALVAATIASTIGVTESPGRPPLDTLIARLKHDQTLIILDNCEHLIGGIAHTADAILRGCPKVKILASSREPLGVGGEVAYRLSTLGPAGAVALFESRATAANRQFALTAENEPVVTEICRRLDGIALAIELAAARVKMLSPKALLEKLDDRFRVVAGGSRTALPRQQTLRALIDWSYDLLSEQERRVFRRLAVFAGGFALEQCAAVCSDESIDEFAIMDLLADLVDKSLVMAEPQAEDTRYGLLESIRDYAREKMEEAGEQNDIKRKHARAYEALADRWTRDIESIPEQTWIARAKPEMENVRCGLQWSFDSGEVLIGQRLAAAVRRMWLTQSLAEGQRWIRKAIERAGEETPPAILIALELGEAHLALVSLHYDVALAAAQRARALCAQVDDLQDQAYSDLYAGAALALTGEISKGRPLLEAAVVSFRETGDRRHIGTALEYLSVGCRIAGDVAGARAHLTEALEALRGTKSERYLAHMSVNLAEIEHQCGNTREALRLALAALDADREDGGDAAIAFDLCNAAAYCLELNERARAVEFAREALELARDRTIETALLVAVQHCAAIAALSGTQLPPDRIAWEAPIAARLLGYADRRFKEARALREYTEQSEYDGASAALRSSLGPRCEELLREGAALGRDEAVQLALSLVKD